MEEAGVINEAGGHNEIIIMNLSLELENIIIYVMRKLKNIIMFS